VTVGAAGFLAPERERCDGGRAGLTRSGASRERTVPLEQIGHSAVKRLWRQKSELIGKPASRCLAPGRG
jgi:hypothetical protein